MLHLKAKNSERQSVRNFLHIKVLLMLSFSGLCQKKPPRTIQSPRRHGGPDRIRTDDPHNANVVRSQLRYKPVFQLL